MPLRPASEGFSLRCSNEGESKELSKSVWTVGEQVSAHRMENVGAFALTEIRRGATAARGLRMYRCACCGYVELYDITVMEPEAWR
jgi:hypothetical protein